MDLIPIDESSYYREIEIPDDMFCTMIDTFIKGTEANRRLGTSRGTITWEDIIRRDL